MKKIIFYLPLFILFLFNCNEHTTTEKNNNKTNTPADTTIIDEHTFAKPSIAVVKHLRLNIKVDFKNKIIAGVASWDIEKSTHATEIIFDTRFLHIEKVTLNETTDEVKFILQPEIKFLGSALHIPISSSTKKVNIYYKTTAQSAALQWLSPQQTAGKKQPFLFTQSEAILARTWVPCQDGPGIRFTYDANIEVPKNLMAVMSVANNATSLNENGKYQYHQPKPIPSYLMALAVGEIQFKKINERCGIYAELPMVEKTAWEFADMGNMVNTAEKLYGPYAWGRYDVIVLPPSFPFGGMENPCLTFATPTVITGDRSLVALIAHELAHSWSGNLATNATWNDFWLNEGFTVYFELRIMEALYSKDYSEMLAALSVQEVNATIAEMGNNNPDTHLKLNLKDRDPDDGMNDIAYIKGYLFLRLMEETVGREKWDEFLKHHFASNAFKSVTTESFITDLNRNLISVNKNKFKDVDINQWIYGPGLPANAPKIVSEKFTRIDEEIKSFSTGKIFNKESTFEWSTHEWLHFLNNLPEKLTEKQLQFLDKTFHFTGNANCEIADVWYLIAIKNNYQPAFKEMDKFLNKVGRRKFLMPLYKEMAKTAEGKKVAISIYKNARSKYHSVSQESIDKLLNY